MPSTETRTERRTLPSTPLRIAEEFGAVEGARQTHLAEHLPNEGAA